MIICANTARMRVRRSVDSVRNPFGQNIPRSTVWHSTPSVLLATCADLTSLGLTSQRPMASQHASCAMKANTQNVPVARNQYSGSVFWLMATCIMRNVSFATAVVITLRRVRAKCSVSRLQMATIARSASSRKKLNRKQKGKKNCQFVLVVAAKLTVKCFPWAKVKRCTILLVSSVSDVQCQSTALSLPRLRALFASHANRNAISVARSWLAGSASELV